MPDADNEDFKQEYSTYIKTVLSRASDPAFCSISFCSAADKEGSEQEEEGSDLD